MTKEKKGKPTAFRPLPENRERLDYAKTLGLELADVINEVLKLHLREYLINATKEKAKQIQKVLSSPVP